MRTFEIKGSYSGHTLVGAILDCHPNVIVANRYSKPITADEILNSYNNSLKWIGIKYSFKHQAQFLYKSDILWLGNTGAVKDPDQIISIVRNPYAMAFSIIKKYKTEEATVERLHDIFNEMAGKVFFYEDLIGLPIKLCHELADYFKLQVPDYWLDAAISLVRNNIPQPVLDINLDSLFEKYEWLQRYK